MPVIIGDIRTVTNIEHWTETMPVIIGDIRTVTKVLNNNLKAVTSNIQLIFYNKL
jgi:hypothetical protein